MTQPPDGQLPRPVSRAGPALVAIGASLWAVDLVLRRPLTGSLSSPAIVFYEHLILAVVLAVPLWITRGRWRGLAGRDWGVVLWIALGGSALGTVCYTQAMKLSNPTTVVLIQKIQPLFAVILARYWLREREPVQGRFWLRFTAAMCAAGLISFGDGFPRDDLSDPRLRSALLALAAAAIWGSCTVAGRFIAPKVGVIPLTGLRISLALPLLGLLAAQTESGGGFPVPGSEQFVSLVLMALIPGLAGLMVYYRGLRTCPASLATLAELCFPAGAALLGWIFLGAGIGALQAVGVLALWATVLWAPDPERIGSPGAA